MEKTILGLFLLEKEEKEEIKTVVKDTKKPVVK